MRARKPKKRVYRKLPPEFASDYIKLLRTLSRKHIKDNADEVKKSLRVLHHMAREADIAKRGELWIPTPHTRTGYFPIIEKVPYVAVRTMLRKNTSDKVRRRARGVVASSAEPFVPLYANRSGTLSRAQRRSLLAHAMVAFPHVKGRHPALLGKKVPGQLGISDIGTRSIVPIHRMAPEDWERGFTVRKFSMSEDLSKAVARRLTHVPSIPNPKPQMPNPNLKEVLKRAMDTKVKLEPESAQKQYILSAADRVCYEDGFRTRLAELKHDVKRRAKRTWRWVRGTVLPTVAREVVLAEAGLMHTERGIPPTTVDLVPVQRIGLNRKLESFPSIQLRGIVRSLQQKATMEVDPVLRKGLERGIADIATELTTRSAML